MKSSCIEHIPNSKLAILREDYMSICDGNHAAAMLLSFFEYWHNIRLEQSEKSRQENEIAEKHGEAPTQNTSLYQFHTAKELQDGLMGVVGRPAIQKGIALLERKGFISIHRNQNPKFCYDATKHFLLHSVVVNKQLSILQELSNRNHINCKIGLQKLSKQYHKITTENNITHSKPSPPISVKSEHQSSGVDKTTRKTKIRSKKHEGAAIFVDLGIEEETIDAFLAIRDQKRAPLSVLAARRMLEEARRAGLDARSMLLECIDRGWQGFRAAWIRENSRPQNRQAADNAPRPKIWVATEKAQSFSPEKNRENMRALLQKSVTANGGYDGN